MDVSQYILLADGTYAAVSRQADWGQICIAMLLLWIALLMTWDRLRK